MVYHVDLMTQRKSSPVLSALSSSEKRYKIHVVYFTQELFICGHGLIPLYSCCNLVFKHLFPCFCLGIYFLVIFSLLSSTYYIADEGSRSETFYMFYIVLYCVKSMEVTN